MSNEITTGDADRKTCTYKKITATTSRLIQLTEALKTNIMHTYITRNTVNNTSSGSRTGGATGALAPLIIKFRGLSPPKMYRVCPLASYPAV